MNGQNHFRPATREEFNLAVAWAAQEGWNPGLDDANVFWETDPDGHVCVERSGEVIATGSIVSYGEFGFMGFFIVRKDWRGRGIGRDFWNWRKERLLSRLQGSGVIGMDGVFDMQPFYAKGGFAFSHRNLRMEGIGQPGPVAEGIRALTPETEDEVMAYDFRCFGFRRQKFLRLWLHQPHGTALGAFAGDRLRGYGVIRQCRQGSKIGPLFAEDPATAESLFVALSHRSIGQPIYLDTPENNADAMRLAQRHDLREVFGCARMYFGASPRLPWKSIYGVTTFELG